MSDHDKLADEQLDELLVLADGTQDTPAVSVKKLFALAIRYRDENADLRKLRDAVGPVLRAVSEENLAMSTPALVAIDELLARHFGKEEPHNEQPVLGWPELYRMLWKLKVADRHKDNG